MRVTINEEQFQALASALALHETYAEDQPEIYAEDQEILDRWWDRVLYQRRK